MSTLLQRIVEKGRDIDFFSVTVGKWNYIPETFLACKVFGNGPSAVLRIKKVAEVCDRWGQEHGNIL